MISNRRLSVTIHAVLDRNSLVCHQGRQRQRAQGTPLSAGAAPNDLWCADFKGEFRLGNGNDCYPLTVTDHASRYLLLCEALASVREDLAIVAFEHLFRERGMPAAIRSDNGVPPARPQCLPELSYPLHDKQYMVTACGRVCMLRKKINISTVLAGQTVGLKEVDDGIWLVSFMHYDLGYIDLEQKTLQPIDNPFGPRLLPMS